MKTLYLIRHGETDWNVAERFQGHIDIPLNTNGRAQARNLISLLEEKAIEAILSSDLSRALETAQIIAEGLKVPVYPHSGLREAHLGEAQGMTRHEMEIKFGHALAHRWRSSLVSDADVCYPGGETGNEIISRVFGTLENFIHSHSHYSKIAVATHGGIIRRVMQKILPSDSPSVSIPNGVVYAIHYSKEENAKFFIK